MTSPKNDAGLTLIELMISMAVAGIVMAAIVSAYQVQVRSKNIQEVTTDMNQAIRAAMDRMESEIRMAGCDPTGDADAGIVTANQAELQFTMDIRGASGDDSSDGDLDDNNEDIRYSLDNDSDGDGIADGTPCDLGRESNTGSGLQTLAENIDGLNFVYLDSQGDALPTPVSDTDDIRSVVVTIIARSGEKVRAFTGAHTDTNTYTNQQPAVDSSGNANPLYWTLDPDADLSDPDAARFRRIQLTKTIHCRNIGN